MQVNPEREEKRGGMVDLDRGWGRVEGYAVGKEMRPICCEKKPDQKSISYLPSASLNTFVLFVRFG